MRSYYSDYTQHCLRFFYKFPNAKSFKTEVDKSNWICCRDVIYKLAEDEQFALKSLYESGDTLSDNIYHFCKRQGIPQDGVWDLVRKVEARIAKRRGLI